MLKGLEFPCDLYYNHIIYISFGVFLVGKKLFCAKGKL